ncbi:hypothetical protein KIPB_001903 [Kipferlia bialata]|uniref:SET domain-containing protein n=1 Tax=Kipferlia bialata TaxID=797122 RepID=A0A9K3GG99_9EUKA|nr:hypothetical protein KIPB_001903 [Kipferlia bialata]|eukprot:g1903.t1
MAYPSHWLPVGTATDLVPVRLDQTDSAWGVYAKEAIKKGNIVLSKQEWDIYKRDNGKEPSVKGILNMLGRNSYSCDDESCFCLMAAWFRRVRKDPTLYCYWEGETGLMSFRAMRDIQPGEALSVPC